MSNVFLVFWKDFFLDYFGALNHVVNGRPLISEFRVNFKGQISSQSYWKGFSFLNIKLGEQLWLATFSISIILKTVYLVKMCPIFYDSASNRLSRYQKILWVCSLGCKNLLNFTWNTMIFYNFVHTSEP